MKRSSLFMIATLALLFAFSGASTVFADGKCCAGTDKGACSPGSGKTCSMDACKDKAQCAPACAKNGCTDKGQCTDACKTACCATQTTGTATTADKGACAKKACAPSKPGECKPTACKMAPVQ